MNITNSGFQLPASLLLPAGEVQVWRIDLEAICAEEPRWKAVLSADELSRAGRFHFSRDRQRYIACRAWLRSILAGYLSVDAKSLSFIYSKTEKPSLPPAEPGTDIMFNVSHSGGIAMLAFARGRAVGIDVEQMRRDCDLEAIAHRFFSRHEQDQLAAFAPEAKADAFFRCWTRKEAYIKATGDGLSLPLSQFDVSLAPGESNALLATRPDPCEADRWLLREVAAGSGYVAALCASGREWTLHDWSENGTARSPSH